MERETRTLSEIELSLKRLEAGQYGICGSCDSVIPGSDACAPFPGPGLHRLCRRRYPPGICWSSIEAALNQPSVRLGFVTFLSKPQVMWVLVSIPLADKSLLKISRKENPALKNAAAIKSEAALIGLARSGSADAFAELSTRHNMQVYRVSLKMLKNREDAEDNLQNTMFKAFRRIKQFNRKSTIFDLAGAYRNQRGAHVSAVSEEP